MRAEEICGRCEAALGPDTGARNLVTRGVSVAVCPLCYYACEIRRLSARIAPESRALVLDVLVQAHQIVSEAVRPNAAASESQGQVQSEWGE